MQRNLIFFTSTYPYGQGETFIENEIPFLSAAFDKIFIVSNEIKEAQTRSIPENVSLLRLNYELNKVQKLFSLANILQPLFWSEIRIIKRVYRKKINLSIVNTLLQGLQKAKMVKKLINTIKNKETDDVSTQWFAYSYWNNDMAVALAWYKRKYDNIIAFSRMHGWDVYFEVNSIGYLPFRKFILQQLNAVFAISDRGKKYYEIWFSELQHKIKVSRLGVSEKKQLNPQQGNVFRMVSVGNLIPIKNINLLIEALSKLKIDFFWQHFGSGYLRNELEVKANKMIPGKFVFMGQISNVELMQFYAENHVDLFINVSLSEGIPVSIMEAMSFGIPAIATDVGGNGEIVKNNDNGFLIKANPTVEEINEKIQYYYNLTADEKNKFRNRAYETWKNYFYDKCNYTNFINQVFSLSE